MKLGQKICPNGILDEFENGFGCFKNMATRGAAFLLIWLYMAIVKPCSHSRGNFYCPIFMKFGQKIGLNDILDEIESNYVCLKKLLPRGGAFFLIWL
jgi:hypothetical protein